MWQKLALSTVAACTVLTAVPAQVKTFEITPEVQKKLDHWKSEIAKWAAEPAVVAAVREQNKVGPVEGMTERQWKRERRRSALVRGLKGNPAAQRLRALADKTDGQVSEAFLNAARGEKVAFLAKTTSYVHRGKAKFDVPFDTGKAWQGKPEYDESAMTYQVQVSVQVVEPKTEKTPERPIGVLVVGLDLGKLTQGVAKPPK